MKHFIILTIILSMTGIFAQETMNIYGKNNKIISIPLAEIEKITYGDIPEDERNTVTDIDSNVYKTIKIGKQTWLQSDLKVTRFNNGAPITHVKKYKQWEKTTAPAYCWYDNNKVDPYSPYGAIYNGYAASMDILCPKGWHVPTQKDFEILIKFCGENDMDSPIKLKERGSVHWEIGPKNVTNETGFTALPSGERNSAGKFGLRGGIGGWWTVTGDTKNMLRMTIHTDNEPTVFEKQIKQTGVCVRCIKDEF